MKSKLGGIRSDLWYIPSIALKEFHECFLYGSFLMQIYFEVAADVAESGAELKDQQSGAERGDEPVVANDNGLRWPFIPFPDGWCASF